jgi:hypothetical protein
MLPVMNEPTPESTDDEIYQWFLAALSREYRAREVRDGVIQIVRRDRRKVQMLLTREQLRGAAWLEGDVTDDRTTGVPIAVNPVMAGLRMLLIYADEALYSDVGEDESYVVLHDGQFWGSTTPTVPPVRGKRDPIESYEPQDGAFVVASRFVKRSSRSLRVLLVITAVMVVAGGVLFMHPGRAQVYFGWASSRGPLPAILFLTGPRLIGIALLWVASLLLAGVVGSRMSGRRRRAACRS